MKNLVTWVVFGSVGLLILGALGAGAGSYLYSLGNQNATFCTTYTTYGAGTCGAANQTSIVPVTLLAGTVVPIIFFVAIAMKFL